MSLLDDFSDNTEIFKGQQNRIDQEAFNALIEKHGLAFAQGYLKAMHEMARVVSNIMMDPKVYTDHEGRPYRTRESQAMAYGKLWHLNNALYKFVQDNELPVADIPKPFSHGTKAQSF